MLEKAYDDLAHPSVKSLGNTASFLPRTIGVWLGKWEKWIINGEESIRLTAQAVQEKASKIPEEKLVEPEPYVAVPAIQQLSYCYNSEELREMYANLLVSSMNTDTKGYVHPAFVDIIKQLTPDEAKLLVEMKDSSRSGAFPLLDIEAILPDNKGAIILHQNFTNIGEELCEHSEQIGAYLDNLDRLKLITISDSRFIPNPVAYQPLENSTTYISYLNESLPEGYNHGIKRKAFFITDFGNAFMETCI